MADELKINTLFLALTRPAMTMGVTHEYFVINALLSMCAFIFFNNIFYVLVFVPIHIAGVLAHRFDNQFIKILFARARLPKVPNESFWGVRTYEPY